MLPIPSLRVLTKPRSRRPLRRCVEYFGKLDVMVNKRSGFQRHQPYRPHEKEDFDLAINTGLYGTFFYMKHAFPELKD